MSETETQSRGVRARRVAAIVLGAGACLVLPSVALGDDDPGGLVGQVPPRIALEEAQAALDPEPGAALAPDREVTLSLRDLAAALPRLDGAERRQARRLLARPTDGTDPQGNTYEAAEATPLCTAHFCVHYVASTDDAPDPTDVVPENGIPDFVEAVSLTSEYAYSIENGPLAWPAPKSDGHLGGSAATDIYLVNVGPDGYFGYAATDPGQHCVRTCAAYLVLDDDFSVTEFGYDDPGLPLRVTLAHEYNHVLQYAIDTFQDGWLFESTATWAEDKVFPNDNDYVNYVRSFARLPGVPITDFDGAHGLKIYGTSVFQHWLDGGPGNFGPGVVVGSWTANSKPRDLAVASVDRSVRSEGGAGFAREFAEFAAASAEWKSLGAFPDGPAYPDVKREGKLGTSGDATEFALDHTAYRLFDVQPAGRTLKLHADAKKGVRSAIALVGRDDSGVVTRKVKLLNNSGEGSVTLAQPSRFKRITAVVVNADGSVRGYSPRDRDWIYAYDNRPYAVSLSR